MKNIDITPVQSVFEQWRAAHLALEASADDADDRNLTAEVAALADRLIDIPSVSPLDVLAKIAAQTLYGECGLEACPRGAEVLREAVSFVGRA